MPTQLPITTEDPFAQLKAQIEAIVSAVIAAEMDKLRSASLAAATEPATAAQGANGHDNGNGHELSTPKRHRAGPGDAIIWRGKHVNVAKRTGEKQVFYVRNYGKGNGEFKSGNHIASIHDQKEAIKWAGRIDEAIDFALQSSATSSLFITNA